jgi:integrase
VHTAAGLDPPGRSEVVRRALSGIRRIRATPPNRRTPLLLADIRTLMISIDESAGVWPAGVSARRDAALLLMGFAGAHRRSELTALTLADITLHVTDGLHVRLRRSKTDQECRLSH